YFHGYKVLSAYPAHRADLKRGIEDFPAHKTFHQTARAFLLRLYRFFILNKAPELVPVFISADEICLGRFETDAESFRHFHPELLQTLRYMRHSLAAPPVASKCPGELSAVRPREHAKRQIPDRLQRLTDDRRRPQKDTVCKEKL